MKTENIKKIKVIFLDIDGVLNVIPTVWDKYGGDFHQDFVDNLGRIIESTGAKIVISSSWRSSGLDVMINMWRDRKYPGEIIGVTPLCHQLMKLVSFKDPDDICRGDEIDWWIKKYEPLNYVILDDDDDILEHQSDNFVCTYNEDHPDKIDIGYGLTNICTEKTIEILNKKII